MTRRARQAGFTLTELMVVVTIIGILVTMAVVYMRPRVRPIDVAMRVGDLFREASRRAVALGQVQPAVATIYGRARTQVQASASGGTVTFTSYRLQEGSGNTASWISIDSYTVDKNTLAVQWAKGVGDQTMSGITTTFDNTFTSNCKPDGTCDSRTVFFQYLLSGPDYESKAKLAVMPLGGAINTRTDWN
jgi:prepilin-type N-terminal cleavage/methylation domain-containing protein